jgi:hypothetical protein
MKKEERKVIRAEMLESNTAARVVLTSLLMKLRPASEIANEEVIGMEAMMILQERAMFAEDGIYINN